MKKTNSLLLIAIIVIMLLLVFSVFIFKQKEINTTTTTNTWKTITEDPETNVQVTGVCEKSDNCCTVYSDCEYIWFTGGCNTPEYVDKVLAAASANGTHLGEARQREGVTCGCESNKCITHG